MGMFILILNGPPDAGQMGITKELMRKERRFYASTNDVKFRISQYSAEKTDRGVVNEIVFGEANAAHALGFSLIVQGSVSIMRGWRNNYEVLALTTGATFLEVNIEAPYDVLVNRFQNRVAKSQADGTPISIWDESELKKRFDAYHTLKNSALPTFDTELGELKQIAEEIEKLLV